MFVYIVFFRLVLFPGIGDDRPMSSGRDSNASTWEPHPSTGRFGFLRGMVCQGASLLPVVLGMVLFLSWGASVLVPVLRYASWSSASSVGGALGYLFFWGVLFWLLRKAKSIPESSVVWGLIALGVFLKLGLVALVLDLPLHADQELFHSFVREMADHRLSGETLSSLSRIYDYPVWAGRVLPVHYAIRILAGDQDLLWTRLLNIVLSTFILLVTYSFAKRLLPEGSRKWAVFLLVALPFQNFVVTDYSHHLFSSFYFLVGMWCAWEMVFRASGLWRWLGLTVLAGACLTLMMWQRGVHFIVLGAWAGLLLWTVAGGMSGRRWGLLLLGLGVVPLLLSIPAAGRYDAWLARHDAHQLNSVLPAFVARGWCPETKGEYCGRYEQLDRVTPWEEKKPAMFRIVLSQIRYNAKVVCGWFPLLKTAKLFLVGYASNLEEGLHAAQSPHLLWARGMRWAAAPVFLGLAFWGCMGLAAHPRMSYRWLPIILAPVLTWGAYLFMGETSPRYSIFCQPFLALLGASALAGFKGKAEESSNWRGVALRGILVLGGIVLGLVLLVAVVRMIPDHHLYANLEEGWTSTSYGGQAGVVPGDYRPFEARIPLGPESGEAQATWRLPPHPDTLQTVSMYLLEANAGARATRLSISTLGKPLVELSLNGLNEPQYLKMRLPVGAEELAFSLESTLEPGRSAGSLQIGYVSFSEGNEQP